LNEDISVENGERYHTQDAHKNEWKGEGKKKREMILVISFVCKKIIPS
jgi:hypothetical protein